MPSDLAPTLPGWLGEVHWIGPPPGRAVTAGFGRIWRWSAADSGATGLPTAVARDPGDRGGIESVLADPPGALEPGLCLTGPGGPVLALGRHPIRRYEPLRHSQWVLLPDGDGWAPQLLFSETADAGELSDRDGLPVARWDKPGRVRRPIGKSDVFAVQGMLLRPRLVYAARPAWGVRAVAGIELSDQQGSGRARIARADPLGPDLTRQLPVWWCEDPPLAEVALTLCCLASVWDACINTTD